MLDILQTVALQTVIILGMAGVGYILLKRYINAVVDQIADLLTEIFQGGPVKHAMSVMGQKSGESKKQKAMVDKIATQVLDSPNLAGLKMLGKQLGIDVDAMVEEEGAVETLSGIQQLAGMLGIDISKFLTQGAKGLNITTGGNSTNPYLGVK